MFRKLLPRSIYDVMAAIACFGVLAGGTAYAANTVFSSDIVDGEVKAADIGNSEIGSIDVKDNSINTFDVHSFLGVDVVDGSLTSDDVADSSLTGFDIANQTLGFNDISSVNLIQVSDDPDSVEGHTCITELTGPIIGKTINDLVFLFPQPDFPAGLVVANVIDTDAGQEASYRVCNVTDEKIDAGNTTFRMLVIRV